MTITSHSLGYRILKRSVDLIFGGVLLILTAPIVLLSAVMIWREDRRPIFFQQIRVGLHGQPFTLIKLRSMYTGDHDPDDPLSAVTHTGRFLRRWSLDELPQLWNVIQGNMSLVGPRPTLPEQVAHYNAFEHKRLEMRPGLTGWAQINGRNMLNWPERIKLDVWYVTHASLFLDLRILLLTPGVLLRGDGLYGEDGRNPDFKGERSSPS